MLSQRSNWSWYCAWGTPVPSWGEGTVMVTVVLLFLLRFTAVLIGPSTLGVLLGLGLIQR